MNTPEPKLQPAPPPMQDDAEETNLLELLDVVLDSRWLIAVVAAVVIALGAAYAFLSTPIFEANMLIQVEQSRQGSGVGPLGGSGPDAGNLFEIQSPTAAEIEILRSRLVVGQAVQNLKLALSVTPKYLPLVGGWLARRATQPSNPGFLGMQGYVTGNESLNVGTFTVPTALEGQRFSVVLTTQGYELLSPDGDSLGKAAVGQSLDYAVNGQNGRLLVAAAVGKPGATFYLVRSSLLKETEKLQIRLNIAELGQKSGVIRAALDGSDPPGIARVLNEMGTLYVRQNIARKAAEAEKSLNFLEGSFLPQLRAQLEDSEEKFNKYRNEKGMFDLSIEASKVLDLAVALKTQLLMLELRRKDIIARFTALHPTIQIIDAQIKNVNGELAALEKRVKALPSLEQGALRLMRDVKVNTDLFVSLLNSASQLRLTKEGTVGNVRIVDVAVVPEERVKPLRAVVMALAAVLGLMAGLALAYLRNTLRPGIKDPADIEQRAGLHVFATVPHSVAQAAQFQEVTARSSGTHLLAVVAPQDLAVESLRSLRTALQFAMLDTANKVVLITGATPGVGKSFISVNFAAVLGAADKKVLLIDADLRKGHLNQYFGLERGNGLSDVVSGSVKIENALHRQVAPNVDFLATGMLPPNPAEVLMTPATQALLQHLAGQYDMVIIDTPPVLAVSDSAILAPLAGAVFLVARAEVSSLGELQESAKRLAQSGAQIPGVIFNGLDLSKQRYGYGVGYKYGRYRYTNYEY